jgi:hypothetical protein
MKDTQLEIIKNIFFNQIRNLSRKKYLEWQRYKQGIDFLDNLDLHRRVIRLETYN